MTKILRANRAKHLAVAEGTAGAKTFTRALQIFSVLNLSLSPRYREDFLANLRWKTNVCVSCWQSTTCRNIIDLRRIIH